MVLIFHFLGKIWIFEKSSEGDHFDTRRKEYITTSGVHLINYMSIRFTFVCNQEHIKKITSPEGDLFDT